MNDLNVCRLAVAVAVLMTAWAKQSGILGVSKAPLPPRGAALHTSTSNRTTSRPKPRRRAILSKGLLRQARCQVLRSELESCQFHRPQQQTSTTTHNSSNTAA